MATAVLRAPVGLVVGERVVEQVVARDREQVVVEPDEVDVADRTEAVVVGRGAVVVDLHVLVLRPAFEVAANRAFVTRWISSALVSAMRSRIQSTIGRPATGSSGFAIESVSGRSRVA